MLQKKKKKNSDRHDKAKGNDVETKGPISGQLLEMLLEHSFTTRSAAALALHEHHRSDS